MIRMTIFMLVLMFGSSTWITINAIWVELSMYTNQLPEGWDLPSYLAAIIQIACLLTLVYSVVHRRTRFNANKGPIILALMTFASICMLLLAIFWAKTVWIFGGEHSLALILLTFFMSLVCAASNMIFLPYMAAFHSTYMTAYFVGMSFSSLVPSLLKLVQGVGMEKSSQGNDTSKKTVAEPLFDVHTYNLAIFIWLCAATLSFVTLHWKFGQAENSEQNGESTSISKKSTSAKSRQSEANQQDDEHLAEGEQSPLRPDRGNDAEETNEKSALAKGKIRFWILIGALALISAEMNTIVPSIQSYATLGYSMLTYHLALTLSNISHPVANFIPIWVKPRSMALLLSLVFICTASTAFLFLLALQSPEPILYESYPAIGSFLAIAVSILAGFLCSYLRTHLTALVRNEQANDEKALFWCGFFMQIGSFLGACVMFPLVNYFKIFRKS